MFRLIRYVDRKSSEVGQTASKFQSLQSCCNMWIAEREKKKRGGEGENMQYIISTEWYE